MKRTMILVYGVICYLLFLGTFLYAIGFLGNLVVPKAIDSPATTTLAQALIVNTLLLGLFALQHSVMARPGFKARWTQIVPQEAERSTYVLFSSLALILLFWLWQPMGVVVWNVQSGVGRTALLALFFCGWLTVLVTTFLINHFDLFGLRQVWLYFQGRDYTPLEFKTPGPYRYVRHPLYVGWLLTFWATPTMTIAHLLFAVGTTAYILIAIKFEERDLADFHGDTYVQYRQRVPMLVPSLRAQVSGGESSGTAVVTDEPFVTLS